MCAAVVGCSGGYHYTPVDLGNSTCALWSRVNWCGVGRVAVGAPGGGSIPSTGRQLEWSGIDVEGLSRAGPQAAGFWACRLAGLQACWLAGSLGVVKVVCVL